MHPSLHQQTNREGLQSQAGPQEEPLSPIRLEMNVKANVYGLWCKSLREVSCTEDLKGAQCGLQR